MKVFNGKAGSGKTDKMLREVNSGDIIICKDPIKMYRKLDTFGEHNIKCYSYEDVVDISSGSNVYIDDADDYLKYCFSDCNLKGFTITTDEIR